ncbi:hypothetical protein [Aporhodopirellula aestuarii]|uniref:Macro domain-containing protein n=1 Tax=Aporhodopirellula aestuarii TaxID=2950107 RepID=A0ABT0UD15_9BACT|nr:hypothetical protein [Aporhodopirellula aestuarii]MCM2374687.1 hypothetical protein [Aporhodopirellula aestuarii]
MTWFTKLTGIEEESPEQVRRELSIEGDQIVCPNGKRFAFGRLETPKLSELRQTVSQLDVPANPSTIREHVGDVRQLHADSANVGDLFQVASQFNLLEMTGPSVTPERGVGIYENDPTQGPACAIACGAGTIYRNYFAPVGDRIGQSADHQIDCSADLGQKLGNQDGQLWQMQNGYLFPSDDGLRRITDHLQSASEPERDELRGELRIGLQWQADVTLPHSEHRVSQAYCSALPVAYGRQRVELWTDFAKLILDAAYEATLLAAVINASRAGVNTVHLTLLGGGVFGNDDAWILGAIERAFLKTKSHGLDVRIVSYRQPKAVVAGLIQRINET